jgi:hypothetical protein
MKKSPSQLMLDMDGADRNEAFLKMVVAYSAIHYAFPFARVRVDLSRRGFHIISDAIPKDTFAARESFGDCSGRLGLDSVRPPFCRNVLWDKKGDFEVCKAISVF